MRLPPITAVFAVLAGAPLLFGCATTASNAHDRVVVAVDAPPSQSSSEVQVTEIVTPIAPEPPPPARRRLSQTVTLGQESYAPAPVPQQPSGQGGPTVVVNNSVTVVNSPPVYYGGYYGGGYYGGGGYGGNQARDGGRGTGSAGSHQAWAPNGWEGAGRTAAPGRTPGVGGNFAPAPNHGPPSMK